MKTFNIHARIITRTTRNTLFKNLIDYLIGYGGRELQIKDCEYITSEHPHILGYEIWATIEFISAKELATVLFERYSSHIAIVSTVDIEEIEPDNPEPELATMGGELDEPYLLDPRIWDGYDNYPGKPIQ